MGSNCSKSKKKLSKQTFTTNERQSLDKLSLTMLRAAYSSDIQKVCTLLEEGFPVNRALGPSGFTLAHLAAQTADLDLLKVCLKYSADLDVQELGEGLTPLMVAAVTGGLKVVETLLRNGATLCVKDFYGRTSYSLALKYRNHKVSELLGSLEC